MALIAVHVLNGLGNTCLPHRECFFAEKEAVACFRNKKHGPYHSDVMYVIYTRALDRTLAILRPEERVGILAEREIL